VAAVVFFFKVVDVLFLVNEVADFLTLVFLDAGFVLATALEVTEAVFFVLLDGPVAGIHSSS
jgi:hypothetical protein